MFPKFLVFITKTGKFRVSIKLTQNSFKRELSIGSERWSTKEFSGEIKDKIISKCGVILTNIIRSYIEIVGFNEHCVISDNKDSFIFFRVKD